MQTCHALSLISMRHVFIKPIMLGLTLWVLTGCSSVQTPPGFDAVLAANNVAPDAAALLIVRQSDQRIWAHGGPRLDARYVAASTSKIPHTFIALESGYVAGPQTRFAWDGTERWVASWNQDQTMATAYARSAVWVFQDISSALGPDKMAEGLALFDYGNQDTGTADDITTYWLQGPLKISALEQVQFLTQLHDEIFPLDPETYRKGKDIMRAGGEEGRFAKTGWYYSEEETDIGWYVGWHEAETQDRHETYVFAFNMDMDDRDNDPPKRVAIVNAALDRVIAAAE